MHYSYVFQAIVPPSVVAIDTPRGYDDFIVGPDQAREFCGPNVSNASDISTRIALDREPEPWLTFPTWVQSITFLIFISSDGFTVISIYPIGNGSIMFISP